MNKIIKVSSGYKKHTQLHKELESAKKKVVIGGIYSHYKHPENTYKVLHFGFIEANDSVCVIYEATYDRELIFIRLLESWLEKVNCNGKKGLRFSLVSKK